MTDLLINEKDAEIIRLKNELREQSASAFITEEISGSDKMQKE